MSRLRGDVGQLVIGFSGGWGAAGEMIGSIRSFRAANPEVEVTLREMGPAEQFDALLAGQLDLGYTARVHVLPAHVRELRAWPMEWHVLLARDHRLTRQPLIATSMLAHETLVTYEVPLAPPPVQSAMARLLEGVPIRVVRTNSIIAVLAHVAAGLGFTLAPGIETHALMPTLVSVPLESPTSALEFILLSRQHSDNPAIRGFIEHGSKDRGGAVGHE